MNVSAIKSCCNITAVLLHSLQESGYFGLFEAMEGLFMLKCRMVEISQLSF